MNDYFEKGTDEVEHVDECPIDDCERSFVGMNPEDVRDHIQVDHNQPLGGLILFPSEEAEERVKGSEIDSEEDA